MASSTRDGTNHSDEIRLWREDIWGVAKDVETGITTQGESRETALENLDEAVALHNGDIGREPTTEELREFGIDPTTTRQATRNHWTYSTDGQADILRHGRRQGRTGDYRAQAALDSSRTP